MEGTTIVHGRRPLHRGFSFRLGAAAVLLGAAGLPCAGARAEEESPRAEGRPDPAPGAARPAPKKKKGDLEWLALGPGIVRVREKYSAAAILYDPAAAPGLPAEAAGKEPAKEKEAAPRGFLADHLADTSTREALRRYVLIRLETSDLEKPYPSPGGGGKEKAGAKGGEAKGPVPAEAPPAAGAPAEETVAAKLMLTAGKPAFLLLSFREEVVRRFEGELPTKTKLRNELSLVTKVNAIHAGEARRVEPEIEASRYAFKLGKTRDAVLKVLLFEGKESRLKMDKVLTDRLDEVLGEYKAKAKEAMAEGDRLDKERKHEEAIKVFDRAQREFPFPEVIRQANRRKSEILRKMVNPFY